ncbi:MAG: hypothetical protein LH468_11700 [Nocardioides sp.]|nr:hypothetical protein [Nocardioides sp.]
MKRTATLVTTVVSLLALAGCAEDPEGTGDAGAAATTPTTLTSSAAPTSTPTPTPTSTPTPTPTQTPEPTPTPTREPSSAAPTSRGPSPELVSVRDDVELVAPSLESFYRDREYPVDLDQVLSTLAEADVPLSPGNRVAGYLYDGDAVEFQLCIENESGAFATYDTAPMTLRRSGETGGCPFA